MQSPPTTSLLILKRQWISTSRTPLILLVMARQTTLSSLTTNSPPVVRELAPVPPRPVTPIYSLHPPPLAPLILPVVPVSVSSLRVFFSAPRPALDYVQTRLVTQSMASVISLIILIITWLRQISLVRWSQVVRII